MNLRIWVRLIVDGANLVAGHEAATLAHSGVARDRLVGNRFAAGDELPNSSGQRSQPAALSFLSETEKSAAREQLAALEKIPAAPSYLGDVVVSFARANPGDPRVPEALHLAVRATRLGCTDDQNSLHSKVAFQLLHRNYPRSEWAAKTQYWY